MTLVTSRALRCNQRLIIAPRPSVRTFSRAQRCAVVRIDLFPLRAGALEVLECKSSAGTIAAPYSSTVCVCGRRESLFPATTVEAVPWQKTAVHYTVKVARRHATLNDKTALIADLHDLDFDLPLRIVLHDLLVRAFLDRERLIHLLIAFRTHRIGLPICRCACTATCEQVATCL